MRVAGPFLALALLAPASAGAGELGERLGQVRKHLHEGQRTKALSIVRGLAQEHPGVLEAQMLYQDVMRASGQRAQLQRHYGNAARQAPRNAAARFLYARVLRGGAAVREYREVVRIDPEFGLGWSGLAASLEAWGKRKKEAMKAAQKGVELAPNDPRTHEALGWIRRSRGDLRQAEASYRTALRLNPASLSALFKLAHLFAATGREQEALRRLKEAQKTAPGDPRVLVHRGLVLSGMGRGRSAARAYHSASRIAPDDPLVQVLLADAYTELSEWELVDRVLTRALELDSQLAPAHAARGYAALRRGRAKDAIEAYGDALSLDRNNPAYLYYFALAKEKAGRLKEAVRHYRRASQAAPYELTYRLALGGAYERLRRPKEAMATYRAATRVAKDDPDVWIRYGHAAIESQRPRMAVRALSQALKLDPNDLGVLKTLGIVYEDGLKKPKEAVKYYRRYLEAGGRDRRVRRWLERLDPKERKGK